MAQNNPKTHAPTFLDGGKLRTIRFNDVSDLERALELNGKNVAAFLVEPIQGEAGYVGSLLCALFTHIALQHRRPRRRVLDKGPRGLQEAQCPPHLR